MNNLLNNLLLKNICRIAAIKPGRFPTHYLLTKRPDLIEQNVDFDKKGYIHAYDLLRERDVIISDESEIQELTVYNPKELAPLSLQKHEPSEQEIIEGIREFRQKKIKKMCHLGEPMKLAPEYQSVLVDLYMVTGANKLDEKYVKENLEDIKFGLAPARTMTFLRYGFFFAMDYNWDSDEEALRFAVDKWFSLIRTYGQLYSQDESLSEEWRKTARNISAPDYSGYKDYESIINFWPYCLSPRPKEILKSYELDDFKELNGA